VRSYENARLGKADRTTVRRLSGARHGSVSRVTLGQSLYKPRIPEPTVPEYKELVELMERPKGMTTGEVLEMLEGSPPARDMPDQPS